MSIIKTVNFFSLLLAITITFSGCSMKKHELKEQKKKSDSITRDDTRNAMQVT